MRLDSISAQTHIVRKKKMRYVLENSTPTSVLTIADSRGGSLNPLRLGDIQFQVIFLQMHHKLLVLVCTALVGLFFPVLNQVVTRCAQ